MGASYEAPLLDPRVEATFLNYAIEGGGDYMRPNDIDAAILVLTKVENWTIVAEKLSGNKPTMRALYRPLDEFHFKVVTRGSAHALAGRIFGSKDVDVGDSTLHERYSVESDEVQRVGALVTNRQFQELWAGCAHPADSRNVIDRCETKPYGNADRQIRVTLNELWGLGAVHDLLVYTLNALARMGAASREHVESEIKPGWGVCRMKPENEADWRAAEEQHLQRGLELSGRRKWTEAIRDFEATITLNPSHPLAHAQRGLAYAQLGNIDRAIADVERATSLSEDDDLSTHRIVKDAFQVVRDRQRIV
jgi:tetratricopeptide (TPR) repeat protein